jgi:Holliday junction resolvase RusA-like endonuclease
VIRFFVAGIPKSLKVAGIARFMKAGRMQMVPKRGNDEWVTLVGSVGRQHAPDTLMEGPVSFTAIFYMPRPKTAKKGERWPLKNPDVDNLAHKLTDQFNRVFYIDDSQIVDFHPQKRFAENGRSGVEIMVEEIAEIVPAGAAT